MSDADPETELLKSRHCIRIRNKLFQGFTTLIPICIVRRILENNFVFVRRDDRDDKDDKDDKDDIQDPEDAAKTADDDTPYFDEDQIGTNHRGKIL